MISVRWRQLALRSLRKLDPPVQKRLLEKVRWLAFNFGTFAPEPLHYDLRELFKARVGDYRIVYSIHAGILIIEDVGNRKDIYE